MNVEIKKSALENLDSDVLVVFVSQRPESKTKTNGQDKKSQTAKTSRAYVEGATKAIQTKIQPAIDDGSMTAAANETIFFRDAGLSGAKHLLTVGLGGAKDFGLENLRQAAGSALNALKPTKAKSLAFAFDTLPHNSLSAELAVQAITEGAILASYIYDEFRHKKEGHGPERMMIVSAHKAKGFDHGVEAGGIIADCVNFARWLGDRPGNKMTPSILADEAVKHAKGTKLKVTVWDRARIKQEKMGSFLSVAQGTAQEPKFILLEYKGAGSSKAPVCFVGKGLTFDAGGISIKSAGGMEEMKYDMCGGANVIATMLAIARLKMKINAIGFVPATENLLGPSANKPGDVVTARNGKTIEINNTDAEGRLILADALVYACEQKPAVIFDIATLTGAMAVALGNLHTGFFTRNDKLADSINDAADISGEMLWRMPLTDHHVKDMKGTYADLSNMSSSRGAGSATATAFLEQFVEKEIPWAHFDIAGTAWHTGDRLPYCPRKGATGVMIRTFLQLADHYG